MQFLSSCLANDSKFSSIWSVESESTAQFFIVAVSAVITSPADKLQSDGGVSSDVNQFFRHVCVLLSSEGSMKMNVVRFFGCENATRATDGGISVRSHPAPRLDVGH